MVLLSLMKIWLLLLAMLLLSTTTTAQNLVVTAGGVGIKTPTLSTFRLTDEVELLQTGTMDEDDVTIDPGGFFPIIFSISFADSSISSWTINEDDGTLAQIDTVSFATAGVSIQPYSGISARSGTLVISGGTGGFTTWTYDADTGDLDPGPFVASQQLPGVVGHPDVMFVDNDFAALSTDFGDGDFGTVLIDVGSDSPSTVVDFEVENSAGASLALEGATANFPLVNCIFTSGFDTFMYTANGAVTVQNPFSTGVDNEIEVEGGAVDCAVQQESGLLAIAGRSGSRTFISTFPVGTDPLLNTAAPEVVEIATSGTFTQIAFGTGNELFFVTTNGDLVSVSDAVIEGGGDGGSDGGDGGSGGSGFMMGIFAALFSCFGLF